MEDLVPVTKLANRRLFADRLSLIMIYLSRDSTLPIVLRFNLAPLLLGLLVGMCVFAAIRAIFKVTRIDPAVVFSR